jgi:FAD/FMN-containing dehydrogenase
MTDDAILKILEERLGERALLRDPADQARYLSDWAGDRLGMPLAVVRPACTAELAEVVALVAEAQQRGVDAAVDGAASRDVDAAARELDVPRQRVIAALDHLGEQQMLEVKAAGVRHRYRVHEAPADLDALAGELHERTLRREASEIERIHRRRIWSSSTAARWRRSAPTSARSGSRAATAPGA